ncbi:MAG: hypothetical protein Q8S55_15035, partial [Methylococcaceae bacterium]|nr:hypothetical protein [Methylococcaceae bacterium]
MWLLIGVVEHHTIFGDVEGMILVMRSKLSRPRINAVAQHIGYWGFAKMTIKIGILLARRGIAMVVERYNSLMLRKPKEMTFIDTQGLLVSLSRQFILMPVLAPTGELLSFASPKESSQRKGDPDSANFLRFSLLVRVFEGPSLAL